ncbi:MAG: hypothetical protein Q9214_001626 [Letrouitia sp. 1 TL-2023]
MEDWLSETIRIELGKALSLKSGEVSNVQTPEAVYEDDGSNLRTASDDEYLQWEKDDEPTHAVISDSATHLRATIASSAARKFNTKDGKQVTEHTLGNVIRLLDSEIVATHLGPRAQRLTMLVKDFEVLGSDRSQAHGQPRPIEAIQENIILLDKLSVLRALESTMRHQNLQYETSLSSQDALSLLLDHLNTTNAQCSSNSQQLFNQVPVSLTKEKFVQHGTETHSPKHQDKRKGFVQSNDSPSERSSSNGSNTTRNQSSPQSNTGKRRKLLGLNFADGEVAGFEEQFEASKPKNQSERLMDIFSKRAVPPRINGPSVASGAVATLPAVDAHSDTQAAGLGSAEVDAKTPTRVESVNGRLEETATTSITTCETCEAEHSTPQRSLKQSSDESPAPKQDFCSEQSLCRLRRRDVQIPKDQQALLDREDCTYAFRYK